MRKLEFVIFLVIALLSFVMACGSSDDDTENDTGTEGEGENQDGGVTDDGGSTDGGEGEADAGGEDGGGEDDNMVLRHYTFRAIGGVSMGASLGISVGARHHEMFDILSGLGGIGDSLYIMHLITRQHLGGFCPMEQIIGDPNTWCGPIDGEEEYEHTQDYNHWIYSTSGGHFDRDAYVDIFEDLALAFGNVVLYGDENNYLPPGVDSEWTTLPDEERCATPVVISNLFDKEYNPDGTFDAITFCEGGYHTGDYDPNAEHKLPITILLAIDYNGNHIRDYGEPVIHAETEPFQDIGCDGVADSDDKYSYTDNPLGTEYNWVRDDCEPYDDFGLDGVDGTGDYGEGDGKFTVSPAYENMLAHNARTLAMNWSDEEFNRIDWYLDAGIRDLFNFSVAMSQLAGYVKNRSQDLSVVDSFDGLKNEGEKDYDYRTINFDNFGKNLYVRYGHPDATPEEIEDGDGAHVGTPNEAVYRFNTFFAYVSARFPEGDYRKIPNASIKGLAQNISFHSKSLDAERNITILLPPGYSDEEFKDTYYPVVYFGHGYGMEPNDLSSTALIYQTYMKYGYLQKMIIVYLDGQCCFKNSESGDINCTGTDDEGNSITSHPGWARVCNRGSFYANQFGKVFDDDTNFKYEDSVIDAIEFVDSNYRTKSALYPEGKDVKVPKDKLYSPDGRPHQKQSSTDKEE